MLFQTLYIHKHVAFLILQHHLSLYPLAFLKLIEKPEVISFAGGLPAPELFPIEEMKEISRIVLEESGTQANFYEFRAI